MFLTPKITIHNFPAVEMINGGLFLAFWVASIIAMIVAGVRWKKIPVFAKIIPFIPVFVWISLVLLLKLGTPKISAEIKYIGSKDQISVDFSHGWGTSGFGMVKNEIWKDKDVGRATKYYRIEVTDRNGVLPTRKLKIDMTKEVPRIGADRTLYVIISDDDIKYEIKK